jgi:hypothetical protein
MCRRVVNLFIFEYKISENSSPQEKLNYQTVKEYNKRFSGQRTVKNNSIKFFSYKINNKIKS